MKIQQLFLAGVFVLAASSAFADNQEVAQGPAFIESSYAPVIIFEGKQVLLKDDEPDIPVEWYE